MERARIALTAALGLLALLVPATPLAPASPAAAAPSPGGRPVYVYGDSVLLGAKTAIEQRLGAKGWDPRVRAAVGTSMPTAIRLIRAERPAIGDVVVLGIGNNYFGDPGVFRREIDEVMGILSGVRRVVWLNLREFRPNRRDANLELARAAGRWSNLEIADWNALSTSRPNVFWSDGLHLRPEGAALMAQLVDERLDAYLAGLPPARVPVVGGPGPRRPRVYGYGGDTGAARDLDGLVTRSAFVGVASTDSGRGYWLAGADGGVFSAGDARFHGSAGSLRLNQPIVGMERTRSGRGYWLVASDGGVFSFGDARFHGSTGSLRLNQPIVGMERTRSGHGYWLVASDGGVFTFGDAPFLGSLGDRALFWPVVDAARSPIGGYWLLTADGRVHSFGAAPRRGDRGGADIQDLFFGISARRGNGYWIAAQRAA